MFILNTGRTALGFIIKLNGRDTTIEFDKRRFYRDTGNMATDGITEISDEVYKELEKQDFFKEQFEKGLFKEVEDPAKTGVDAVKAKDAEIAKLKKELASEKKKNTTKELEDKDKEIKSLKEKLEALSAKALDKEETEEKAELSEGF